MEKFTLDRDINLLCVRAKSFPQGVADAFKNLENLHPSVIQRDFYGISHSSENGEIIYKAAVEESFDGEAETFGCEKFTIRKGEYATETIHDFTKNLEAFGSTFHKLLQHPQLDPNAACVEWYKNGDEVLCMVRLENN